MMRLICFFLAVTAFLAAGCSSQAWATTKDDPNNDVETGKDDPTQDALARTYSSVTLSFGGDSTQTSDANLDFLLGLENRTELSFGAGSTRSKADNGDLNTGALRAGWTTDSSGDSVYGATYEYWGQKDSIRTNTFGGIVRWNREHFSLGLTPKIRIINLTALDPSDRRRYVVTNPSLGGRFSVVAARPFLFSVNGAVYNYSADLGRLDAPQAASTASNSALTLSRGFLESEAGGSIGYSVEKWSLTTLYSHTVTAIDRALNNCYSADLGLYFVESFEFVISAGQTYNASNTSTGFGSVAVTYLW